MEIPENQFFACIHGHFYQPPRENPWLAAVEVQDSAAPYHDWNERVTAECYAPNAAARLLDDHERITALRNNYNHISFNFGPTLLAWMEHARPDVYAQIRLADQESCRRLGRGNAMAQVYGHCIMPLASPRDQHTQVRWGIADFVRRFGRPPDGMWLPETAVDRGTLAVLAENGMRFTILAPSQAARVRGADGQWRDASDGLDCTRPYRCTLEGGRQIVVFFYDAEIAHAIAFGGLLNNGGELARRLGSASVPTAGPSIVSVATDGESYGHHHRFGEMALATAIEALDRDGRVQLTNYAAYLDRVPVTDEVEIRNNTSWSCGHGVERWRANCGCHSGTHPDWQQTWRAPLRAALDWLKARVDTRFESSGARLLRDPWAARDAYIDVLLHRDTEHQQAFLDRHVRPSHKARDVSVIWKLLEMQRHALLSFTSCGWFFDEPSGIETVQNLTYAARALQLAAQCGANLEPEFLRRLQPMHSNLPAYADGRQLYQQLVAPQVADGQRVAAHYAITTLFAPPPRQGRIYAYRATSLDHNTEPGGEAGFAVGRVRVDTAVTQEGEDYAYAALQLGGHDIHCAVAPSAAVPKYPQLKEALLTAFLHAPLTELVRRIDQAFDGTFYTLQDVFVAERRHILDQVMARAMAECTADYERMVTNHRRLLDFLAQAHVPLPPALRVAATFVTERHLASAIAHFVAGEGMAAAAVAVWRDAERWSITPRMDDVRGLLEEALEQAVGGLTGDDIGACLVRAHAILDLAAALALTLNTWRVQGQYYALVTATTARQWPANVATELRRLGERLNFALHEWEAWTERAA